MDLVCYSRQEIKAFFLDKIVIIPALWLLYLLGVHQKSIGSVTYTLKENIITNTLSISNKTTYIPIKQ